jgi:threonine/homoserine/homoserine lactone efflux protein
MWERLRVIFGVALVLLILVIVVSPYVDLPFTTLRARQMALRVVGLFVVCWIAIAGTRQVFHPAERPDSQELKLHSHAGRYLLGLTCALLC